MFLQPNLTQIEKTINKLVRFLSLSLCFFICLICIMYDVVYKLNKKNNIFVIVELVKFLFQSIDKVANVSYLTSSHLFSFY
jgi:hypothetical protein